MAWPIGLFDAHKTALEGLDFVARNIEIRGAAYQVSNLLTHDAWHWVNELGAIKRRMKTLDALRLPCRRERN
jgi:hypothetical protein